MNRSTLSVKHLAQSSYLALMLWVLLWHSLISPHPHLNAYAVTIGWMIPLLFPLKGILKGNPYTHAWSNFVLMLYFLHALTLLWVGEGERWLAAIELCLTSVTFYANVVYAKRQGKVAGLGLKKLS